MASKKDYINEFNTQGQLRGQAVRYEYTAKGPQNDEQWFATVYLGEAAWATGEGRSKRAAQADAAGKAMALVAQGY
ncbi:hypothetical protein FPV67DRAFT_1663726 [Lyophyllum atratum]|nr:hypothetical protein FPV67DRAFT_1663726 [Lyophyllum atratum]